MKTNFKRLISCLLACVLLIGATSVMSVVASAATAASVTDGWYYIKGVHSQKYLQVANNKGANGVNVEIGTGNGSEAQKWYVTNVGNGYVTLKNGLGYMLDVAYGSGDNSANIQTYSANGADAQKFKFAKTSNNGVYGIVTKSSNDARALDVSGWGTSDGVNVLQWDYYGASNQLWTLEAIKVEEPEQDSTQSPSEEKTALENGWYFIKGVHSQKNLQVNGKNDGANVEISSYNEADVQKWYVTNLGDGYVTIKNGSGYMLDVENGSSDSGANIRTVAATNGDSQKFKLISTSASDTFGIVSKVTNNAKGLDVYNWGSADGVNVCQWDYYNASNQLWIFTATDMNEVDNTPAVPEDTPVVPEETPVVPEETPVVPEETPDTETDDGTVAEGWYYIRSPYANKYLQVAGNKGGNGVNVEIGTGTKADGQKWYVADAGNGYVTLKNGLGYMLDVIYGNPDDGTNIQTYSANGATAQQFKIVSTAKAGEFGIVTRVSDNARGLDIYNWSTADGTNICQWSYYGNANQMWVFEKIDNGSTESGGNNSNNNNNNNSSSDLMKDYVAETYAPDEYLSVKSNVAYGNLIKTSYYSTTCEKNRNIVVLLPAGYDKNKEYPVMYMLHGFFENETTHNGLKTLLGNLMSEGLAEDMIVVFPYIFASKTMDNATAFDAVNAAAYDNFINELTNDVMPFIKANYSIKEGRDNTAIIGFSMGGRESLAIGFTRPDLFGYVGAIAPAPGLTPGRDWAMEHPGQFAENELVFEENSPYFLMICCGDKDGTVGSFPKSYHNILDNNKVEHVWYEVPGSNHGDPAISSGIYNFAKTIFK